MFIPRTQSSLLTELKQSFPILSLTGPRQSGKTTLLRHHFSSYRYVSFEQPSVRTAFESDPEGFLRQYNKRVIFDEAQNGGADTMTLEGVRQVPWDGLDW